MRSLINAILVASLVLCLVNPLWAAPGDPVKDVSAGAMTFDFVLMRPLGLAATVFGAVLYVASLPFSAAGGNQLYARQKLVQDPANYTFQRQLGDF